MILFFCRGWIRLINLHLPLFGKCDKSKNLPLIWFLSNALGPAGFGHWTHQNSVRVHKTCSVSLAKVNASTHLLTTSLLSSKPFTLKQNTNWKPKLQSLPFCRPMSSSSLVIGYRIDSFLLEKIYWKMKRQIGRSKIIIAKVTSSWKNTDQKE